MAGVLSGLIGSFRLGSYDLIQTFTLGSNTSSVTFSGLNEYINTYKHLQIRWTARTTRVATETQVFLRTNINNSASYFIHSLHGNGSSVLSTSSTSANPSIGFVTTSSSTGNAFAAGIIDILDPFSTTKNKTIRSFGGAWTSPNYVYLNSFSIADTAAINSLTMIDLISSGLVTGSRFSLYGIR
jgi:hypothetical protein